MPNMEGEEYSIFSNYPQGRVTVTEKIVNDNFRYEEPFVKPQWTILAETDTMMNLKVQKAKCTFAGREYDAWFTMEIPVDRGPWKLHGLPGLIVKVADTQQYFSFTLAAVELPKTDKGIALDSTVSYIEMEKGKFLSLYERSVKYPIQYINSSTSVRVTPKNSSSNPNKPRAYNPIER